VPCVQRALSRLPRETSQLALYVDGRMNYYLAALHGVQVNGTMVDGRSLDEGMLDPMSLVVDSGTSLLLLEEDLMESLRDMFLTNYSDLPGVGNTSSRNPSIFEASVFTASSSCLELPAEYDWSQWPSLGLLLDGVAIEVPAPLYFVEATANT